MSATVALTASAPPMVGDHLGSIIKNATRPADKLPQWLIDEAGVLEKDSFEAGKHLNFQPPSKIFSMKEIGLEGQGISPNAVTAPFQLFTETAIKQMRAEIFSEPVLSDCQYTSDFVQNTIRGMGSERAPFTCDAWNSPEVLSKISDVAGIELIPAMDYEIAAINISLPKQPVDIIDDNKTNDEDLPAFAWHRDSYPFVCVTMLSDCTGMVGGETALKTASGEIMKVRGPAMGTAVVMQGRYIEHQALKAFGGRERISMITSFRPKSPFIRDETVLTGVRPISTVPELYAEFNIYRMEVLEERLRASLAAARRKQLARRKFDVAAARRFLTEQKEYLEATITELTD